MARTSTILIAGPTASGKSALALALAERLGGEVINADSMQVYRELEILTARPSAADRRRAPHRLYGHVPAAQAYSAGRFVAEAGAAIGTAHAAGRVAIVVGGTGLYLRALTEGLAPIPAVPEEIRARWRGQAAVEGAAALHAMLADRDPAMAARLRPSDAQRVTRALEVLEATGRSLAEWQAQPGTPLDGIDRAVRLVVEVERRELYRRCDARLAAMISAGALEEVRALTALGLPADLPALRAVGVAPLARHLAGEVGLQEAVRLAATETRQYAKRQLTWLRRNMITWNTIFSHEMEQTERDALSFIDY
ncbi:MAG: tRNA (adenosine(37)-N6)-dimethylallyltransferase MiaA [Pseudomonadota bacterium]